MSAFEIIVLFAAGTGALLLMGWIASLIIRKQLERHIVNLPPTGATVPAPIATLPAPNHEWLVPITEKVIQQAAESALRKSHRSVYSDGQQLFFNLEVIDDLTERQEARDLLLAFNRGETDNLRGLIDVATKLTSE
jgi:hypothetical protein